MADFKPISTQEEFDGAIKSRLARERATLTRELEAKYADYEDLKAKAAGADREKDEKTGNLQKKIEDLTAKITEADAKIKAYELEALRAKVAAAEGVPAEFVTRLKGTTEKELVADAKALSGALEAINRKDLPGFSAEDKNADPKEAAYRKMAENFGKGDN